jgi:hypothetical protein
MTVCLDWLCFRGKVRLVSRFCSSALTRRSGRKAGDADIIPEELTIPLAVAGELLDPSIATPLSAVHPHGEDSEHATTVSDGNEDAKSNVSACF